MMPLCKHRLKVCSKCVVVTDAAKRVSDTINGLVAFKLPEELAHTWCAFKLADGTTDGNLYYTKKEAVDHQLDEKLCMYIYMRRCLTGVNPRDMQLFLDMHRFAYEEGIPFHYPDVDLITPVARNTGKWPM